MVAKRPHPTGQDKHGSPQDIGIPEASPPAEPCTNTVLVPHLFNITEAARISLDEGAAAVFLPVAE